MFNPYESSLAIKKEYIDYISTIFPLNNENLKRQFINGLNRIIDKGPYIDIKPLFKTTKTLNELIEEGVVSKLFKDLESNKPKDISHKVEYPLNRPLYAHQEKALRKGSSENLVVTTGTGSGKTECFMLPILNKLLKEIEINGSLPNKVKVLIIYPMNALANDQLKRLRNALMYYPQIRFASYTGETEQSLDKAKTKYSRLHENETSPELRGEGIPNELKSRDEIIETIPHILVTNYAMLERLLLKKENDDLFTNSELEYVVLDEAHVYQGTKGMETSLLIRRLKARIDSSRTKFILTSATLGNKNESEDDICEFANNLTGANFKRDSVIFGERKEILTDGLGKEVDENIFKELTTCLDSEDDISFIFDEYGENYDYDVSIKENIYNLCFNSIYYKRLTNNYLLENQLIENVKKLPEILGMNTVENAVSFIYVASYGEKDNSTLLDSRYHYFLRALEGCYISFSSRNNIFLERKDEDEEGYKVFELSVCKKCGDLALYGAIVDDHLVQISGNSLDKNLKGQFFHLGKDILSQEVEDDDLDEISEEDSCDDEDFKDKKGVHKITKYLLCPKCGRIRRFRAGVKECDCGEQLIIIYSSEKYDGCLVCKGGQYNKFYLGNDAATGVITTSLFKELPIKHIGEYKGGTIQYRDGGKQFLAFSDNRAEAAFYAVYMNSTYETFLRRKAINYVISNNLGVNETWSLNELARNLTNLFIEKKTFKVNIEDDGPDIGYESKKQAWYGILTELANRKRNNSLCSLGILSFEYGGLDELTEKVKNFPKFKDKLDLSTLRDLLNEIVLTFASWGAVEPNKKVFDLTQEDRSYIYYTKYPKYIVESKTYDEKADNYESRYLSSWLPRVRKNDANKYIKNSRYYIAKRMFIEEPSDADIKSLLSVIFKCLIRGIHNEDYKLKCANVNNYYFDANAFIVKNPLNKDLHWYRCEKCGRITNYTLHSNCTVAGCDGKCNEINDLNEFYKDNHYRNLYSGDDFNKLFIKEHTAQISKSDAANYQEYFDKNKIHALSSSTTFEMGVDVGSLETVFLRDVPPAPSNYTQRSGRAGRSKDACAYTLTYAKLSSHDFNYFREPKNMICGKVLPPKFKLNNDKILLRHIFAVVISYLFKYNYMNAYKLEESLSEETLNTIREVLNKKEENVELTNILRESFKDIKFKTYIPESYNWLDKFCGTEGALTLLVSDFNSTIQQFNDRIEELNIKFNETSDVDKQSEIDKTRSRTINQRKFFLKHKLIDELSRGNVLPKYGFPVDIAKLDIGDANTDLSRDLSLAISEYAPGETVIADGRQYVSRYIKKRRLSKKESAFNINYIARCENKDCGTFKYSKVEVSSDDEQYCAGCGKKIPADKWQKTIVPEDGFYYDYTKNTTLSIVNKPKKIYNSEAFYVGNNKEITESILEINNHNISLKHTENDEIMVVSNTAFYVCPNCGYTIGKNDKFKDENGKIDKEAENLRLRKCEHITTKFKHLTISGRECHNHTFERNLLSHIYKTDVVELNFSYGNCEDKNTMYSLMTALIDSMSNTLNIEKNDIAGCLNYVDNKYRIILYDAVPGGAGHVKRLLEHNGKVFNNVLRFAYEKMTRCTCGSSCYNCLRTYYNQFHHDELDRYKVIKFLEDYKGECLDKTLDMSKHIINNSLVSEKDNFLTLEDILKADPNIVFNPDLEEKVGLLCEKIKNIKVKTPSKTSVLLNIGDKKYEILAKWQNEQVALVESDNIYFALKDDSDYSVYNIFDESKFDEFIDKIKE